MGWQMCFFNTPVTSMAIKQVERSLDLRQSLTGLRDTIDMESHMVRHESQWDRYHLVIVI